MTETALTTPVAFAIFNRPEITALTFARIAAAKPTQLLIIADGPRPDHPTDVKACAAVRAIVERIDWECEVRRNYSEVNLGARRRLSSGFDWVFDQVEAAIILEDDILADPTFFRFAQEMLDYYRDDGRVMHIASRNPVLSTRQPPNYPYSYYFSSYGSTWGWASWRRAWQIFDVDMELWSPLLKAELMKHPALNETAVGNFEAAYKGIDAWDYQWHFARRIHNGLSVLPRKDLVRNIGIGNVATNTKNIHTRGASRIAEPQEFPLIHPPYVMPWPSFERAAKRYTQGFHWRNQFVKKGPKWLTGLGQRLVRWMEMQELRRAAVGKS